MLKKIFGTLKKAGKKQNSNAGSSIILAIVSIAFVGALVSAIVYMSYYNYLMKYGDRSSKENFYTVETAMDEISMGLQRELSASMAESYTYTSRISDMAVQAKEELFQNMVKNSLRERLKQTDTDKSHYQVNKLTLYLDKTRYNSSTGVGAVVLTTDADAIMTDDNRGVILKNVEVQYTDARGYVSIIKTDIVLKLPSVDFVSSKEVPELEQYAIIANRRLQTEASTKSRIAGNVYGGYEGIFAVDYGELTFGNDDSDAFLVVAKNVVAENGSDNGNSLVTKVGSELWTEQIEVTSANISLGYNTYVSDDLTIDGRNSKVTLKGNYYGYGNNYSDALGSSSILVNGANTTLDMSGLSGLMLMGHAYIGARHYNANSTVDSDYVEDISSISSNSTDVVPINTEDSMLGQSVAVKSDQLMYMVPTECMGYEGNVQILAKNPITLSEYNMLTKTIVTDASGAPVLDAYGNQQLKYKAVRLDQLFGKLGRTVESYGAGYQTVFRRVNGSILVYYYLTFNSETMANRFFQDYYAADKAAIDAYIKEYVADFKWNNALGVVDTTTGRATYPLHLAGNLVYFDSMGSATLKQDTNSADVMELDEITRNIDGYIDTYAALSSKLLTNKENVTVAELNQTVYENIVVEDSTFSSIVAPGFSMSCDNGMTGDDLVRAVVVNNKNSSAFEITDANSEHLHLVIASGDVRVMATKFDGLIISGGEVSLGPTCVEITANPIKTKEAMNCKDSTKIYSAADVLIDKEAYLNYISVSGNDYDPTGGSGFIRIDSLVHFENWSKE